MNKPQIIVFTENNLNFTPFDVKWMPKSAKVITIGSYPNGTGAFEVYELSNAKLDLIDKSTFPKSLKCATFGASSLEERHIAIGDFSGRLNIVDLARTSTPVYSAAAHASIINCIDGIGGLNVGKGAAEVVTGSSDGTVKVWDIRQKDKPVVAIEPEEDCDKRDCWAVAFGNSYSNTERMVCAGFDNGDLKLFDMKAMKVLWEQQLSNGICSLQFDRKDIEINKLVVTTLESNILVFDLRTFHAEKGFASLTKSAHKSTIWCVRHLPQDREIFLTSGGNGSLNLWKYHYPESRKCTLKDGTEEGVAGEINLLQDMIITAQPITSLDLSSDKRGLCSCISIDQMLRLLIITKLNTV